MSEKPDSPIDPAPLPSVEVPKIAYRSYLYLTHNGKFFYKNNSNEFCACSHKGIDTLIKGEGVKDPAPIVKEIMRNCTIDMAGIVAGYPEGIHKIGRNTVLITKGLQLIPPYKGDCEMLKSIYQEQLWSEESSAGPEHDQRMYMYGADQYALQCLYKGTLHSGQAVFLCGEPRTGKSLIHQIRTIMFSGYGGVMADPHEWMIRGTSFNSELFEREHWVIDDPQTGTTNDCRRKFAQNIKNILSPGQKRIHPKGSKAVMMNVFTRLTVCLNDHPDDLRMLPPLDESIRDKVMIFKCRKHPMPMPTETPEEKKIFWEKILSEIPCFIWWLLNEFKLPRSMVDERFGVKAYQHPELVEAVQEMSTEAVIWGWIEQVLKEAGFVGQIAGSATDILYMIKNDPTVGRDADKFIRSHVSMGLYLKRLQKLYPERVKHIRTGKVGERKWGILRSDGVWHGEFS